MKNIIKKIAVNSMRQMFKNRRGSPEEEENKGMVEKGLDAGRNAVKSFASKKVKTAAKKVVTSKFVAVLGVIFLKILIIVICCMLILLPLSYGYILFQGAFSDFNEFTLKTTTNLVTTFKTWYLSDDDDEKKYKNAESYENYILERFKYISEETLKEEMDSSEATDLKQLAVSWVYGKVYNDYFKNEGLRDALGAFFGGQSELSQAPILKSVGETATEIYTPKWGSSTQDARKEVFGDSINIYDIEAFDYVAGTLYDLLDIDLELARERLIAKYKTEIDKTTLEYEMNIYKKYTEKILKGWTDLLNNYIKNEGLSKYLEQIGLSKDSLKYSNINYNLKDFYRFYKDNYNYSSSEDFKWFIKVLGEINSKDDESIYSIDVVAESLITNKNSFNKILSISNELEYVFKEYVLSLANTTEQYNKLSEKIDSITKKKSFGSIAEGYSENVEEDKKGIEVEAIQEITNDDLTEELKGKIKELNLFRSQQAAASYKAYLTELETVTTVAYYSIDLSNPIFEELYSLPIYTVDFFDKYANSSKDLNKLFNSAGYYSGLEKRINDAMFVKERASIANKMYIDATQINPIVSAIDNNTGIDYYSGYTSIVLSDLSNLVNESKQQLMEIQQVFKSAQSGDKNALSKLESKYWANIDGVFSSLTSNKFYNFYLGDGFFEENSSDAYGLKSDVSNRETNGTYWNGFVNAHKSYGANKLGFIPFDYKEDILLGDGSVAKVFADYYMKEGLNASNYVDIYENYNALLNTFVDNATEISILRQEPNIKGDGATYYERVNQLISLEIQRLSSIQEKMKSLASSTVSNDPNEIFKEADITRIYKGGTEIPHNNSLYIHGNILEVKKYRYTQEEAVKTVATTHYSDILAKFKATNGSGSVGAVIDIGDMEIGTNTVPGAPNYSSYEAAAQYLPLIETIVKENGDLIDPYYLVAMIATESGGNLRPAQGSETAAGLMQIENVHWGNTVTLPSGKTITLDKDKLGTDARLSIEAGLWQALNTADKFRGNLFMGIVGYNMGTYAMERIVFLTLVGEGKASISDWVVRGTALGEGPQGRLEAYKLRPLINEYIDSGSLSWLNYRAQYQSENWYGGGTGTLNHLEKVLAYYNTSQGMPWYRPYKGADKIYIGKSGDASLGEDENGDKTYHKENRLILWEEYYSDNDTFRKLDNWAKNKNTSELNNKLLSKMIINSINAIDTTLKKELSSIDISNQEFKALLAGTLNAGTSASIDGSSPYTVISEPGFKLTHRTQTDVDNLVKKVAIEYINLYKMLNGKDKDYAIYLYVSNDRELAKLEIANETVPFAEFVKNKYISESESYTSISPEILKVAQILSGDLNVDANNFYNILEAVSNPDGEITIVNPIDEFYAQWLEAKYLMHEIYNTMIEDTNTTLIKNGNTPYDVLPTLEEVLNNLPSEYDSDIEGTLTVKGQNGETYSVIIKKNFLTELTNKAIGSIENIVIHDTGSTGEGGKATAQYDKMNTKDANETMHYVVGSDEIYHFVQDNSVANHINDSATATGGTRPEITNSNSLGIQFEANSTRDKDKVFWHTVAITKYLMDKNPGVSIDDIVLHNDVTGTNDSSIMLKNNKEEWKRFIEAVKKSTVSFEANTGNLAGIQYKLVSTARSLLGQPYVYGAAGQIVSDELINQLRSQFGESDGEYSKTPRKFFNGSYKGFDCSSFVQYVYAQNGITISRTTYSQLEEGTDVFKSGEKIDPNKLLPGDLLFSPGHVMMWIGNGEYIHAPYPGEVIKIGKGVPSNVTRVKRIVESKGKFEFYSQHDSRWANFSYSTDNISGSGCGPTSTAMVLSGLTHNGSTKIDTNKDGKITPDELAAYSTKQGTVGADGTYFSFYSKVGAELDVPVREIVVGSKSNSLILEELKTELKAGKGVVASYGNGHWITGGHLIAFVGVSSDNKIIVHDPNIATYKGTLSRDRYNGPNPDSYIIGGNSGALRFFVFG